MTLPEAPWRHSPGLARVVDALGGTEGLSRLVGGCVRDALAGHEPKDVDIATQLQPDQVILRLEAAGIKAVPTGLNHGTITAVADGQSIEVTTLRRDVATDGRRATIAYTTDWHEDAARRDFTINALSADPQTGQVSDYFGGVADLSAQIVRFIGEPLTRIAEDHLRILRFFRFHARFGGPVPHAESLAACVARANDLMALSRERIAMELLAILALPDPGPIITLMVEQGIFKAMLPEITDAAPLVHLVAREEAQGVAGDPLRRLSALLPAVPAIAEGVGARLKLSNAMRKRLSSSAGRQADDAANPLALGYQIGVEGAIDRLLLGDGDGAALKGWTPPTFPLSGGAVIKRGLSAGPLVAACLKAAERQWVAEGFPDAARAGTILDGVVADQFPPP